MSNFDFDTFDVPDRHIKAAIYGPYVGTISFSASTKDTFEELFEQEFYCDTKVERRAAIKAGFLLVKRLIELNKIPADVSVDICISS